MPMHVLVHLIYRDGLLARGQAQVEDALCEQILGVDAMRLLDVCAAPRWPPTNTCVRLGDEDRTGSTRRGAQR